MAQQILQSDHDAGRPKQHPLYVPLSFAVFKKLAPTSVPCSALSIMKEATRRFMAMLLPLLLPPEKPALKEKIIRLLVSAI